MTARGAAVKDGLRPPPLRREASLTGVPRVATLAQFASAFMPPPSSAASCVRADLPCSDNADFPAIPHASRPPGLAPAAGNSPGWGRSAKTRAHALAPLRRQRLRHLRLKGAL